MDRHVPTYLTSRLGTVNAEAVVASEGGTAGDVSLGRYSTIIKPVAIPTSAPISHKPFSYTVAAGETLGTIASKFHVSVSQIRWSNTNLISNDTVNTGDQIVVPPVPGVVVSVRSSDTIEALADPSVVVAGPYGLRGQGTPKEFAASPGPEVDAIEGYCMAFRESDAEALGGFDPRFQFYRIADIEFSFRLRDRGGRAVVVPDLPLEKHEHRLWEATDPKERQRLSKRNMYRFLDRWGNRPDLLVGR